MRRNMVLRGRTRVEGMMGRDRLSISLVSFSASVVHVPACDMTKGMKFPPLISSVLLCLLFLTDILA